MKAIVFHGLGDIRLDEVREPTIDEPTDAIVRITAAAICGTDLHMIRGTMPGMKSGTVLGHEGVGIIEALGDDVRNLSIGDRVVIPSTIACGVCSYCRAGYYSQCDNANENGTAFFGGPAPSGPFDGMQAEKVRVPYANVGLCKVPDAVRDEQALLCSDIWPTAWFAADMADISSGKTVAVLGCGPVGLLAIASAKLMGAGRVFAIDCVPSRLERARLIGAECIDFDREDPVATLKRLTDDIGVDRVIDAVGVDAHRPHAGPASKAAKKEKGKVARDAEELLAIDPKVGEGQRGDLWVPGDAPTQALDWAIEMIAKAGTLSIVGVYPETDRAFPIGKAMNKNLTLRMGNCPHRKYIPKLLDLIATGRFDPTIILSQEGPLASGIAAYEAFDRREDGWIKVALLPPGEAA